MPHINELKTSKFLKKEDCGQGILVTIQSCDRHNVAAEGAPEEAKWCLTFDETDKPMVLNSTNGQIIAKIVGSENTDDWPGHKIVLYHDQNVQYAGKLIGGIRARAPRNQAAPAAPRPAPSRPAPAHVPPLAAQPTPPAEPDDIPF